MKRLTGSNSLASGRPRGLAARGLAAPGLVALGLVASPARAQPEPDPPEEEAPPTDTPAEEPAERAPDPELEKELETSEDASEEAAPRGETAAEAATDPPDTAAADGFVRSVEVGGYFDPGFGFRSRPDARERDKLEYGFFGDAGLTVLARPFERWEGRLHVVFSTEAVEAITDVDFFDIGGDGSIDGADATRSTFPGLFIEEAVVAFVPVAELSVEGGVMRIPFTAQQQSPTTTLMFPSRSSPNQVFVTGSDVGALAKTNIEDGVVTGSVGVFNGDSLGLTGRNKVVRDLAVSGRADVNPFGGFPFDEGDRDGPFRLGLGAGFVYRPAEVFDDRTGLSATNVTDVRFSGTVRMAFAGLYLGVEALRRQKTDDFSNRPETATGAYAQASFFFRVVPSVGLEPIARLGFVAEDDSFQPQTTGWTDAGINIYPQADDPRPDDIKLTLQYLGERRFTEGESAHGGAARAQLSF